MSQQRALLLKAMMVTIAVMISRAVAIEIGMETAERPPAEGTEVIASGSSVAVAAPQPPPAEVGVPSPVSADDDLIVPVPPTMKATLPPDDLDATGGEVEVSRDSRYCDWEPHMGPVCQYNGTTHVVVVPLNLHLDAGQLEVEILGAHVLHVYPSCVSWIKVFHSKQVTTLAAKVYKGAVEEKPDNGRKTCRTWLRVYNSHVDMMEHGLKDVTLIETQVNTIRLTLQRDFMAINSTIESIESLEWKGYRATIHNTTIQRLSGVKANDNLLISESRIGYVPNDGLIFNARQMTIINTSVTHIFTGGLTIANGGVALSNVTIKVLEEGGITVNRPSAFLALTNVTIEYATAPCFILLDRNRISLNNVTLKGLPMDFSSPFLKFQDDITPKDPSVPLEVAGTGKGCSASANKVKCDFSNINESIELHAANIQGYDVVEIRNTKALQVVSTNCHQDLQLHSVQGSLPHFSVSRTGNVDTVTPLQEGDEGGEGETEPDEEEEEECNISLNVTSSKLGVASGKYISNMTLKNSTLGRLHGGRLLFLALKDVTVEQMDSVTVAGNGGVWKDVRIGNMYNVTFKGPISMGDIHITQKMRKGSLTVDHPGKDTIFTRVLLPTLERGSVVIKRGKVVIKELLAINIHEGAIVVEENATLVLDRFTSLLTPFRPISVASRDQVVTNKSRTYQNWGGLLHFRHPSPTTEELDPSSNLTLNVVHHSPYCNSFAFMMQICDFSHVPQAAVTVDIRTSSRTNNRVMVRGAEHVTVYPSCIEKLTIYNVKRATTIDSERECATWLEATGVNFDNITSGVLDLTLTSSSVNLLAPDRILRDLDIDETRVKHVYGVRWSDYSGFFNSSVLERVDGLVAESTMMMSNTSMETILPNGLTILAQSFISNSTIGHVNTNGITVEGVLHLKAVTFSSLAKKAIVVKNGLLVMINVSIASAEETSIVADKYGGVSFQNVTVGGKSIFWKGYLKHPQSTGNDSLVLLNEHLNADDESSNLQVPTTLKTPSVPDIAAPVTKGSSPQAASRTQPHTSSSVEKGEDSATLPGPLQKAAPPDEASATSWKWAGAGIGFFAGLLVGTCILITVKVIMPNKGRLSMPAVFWRVKEDQHELLTDDQTSLDLPNSTRRDEGYQSVPATDLI